MDQQQISEVRNNIAQLEQLSAGGGFRSGNPEDLGRELAAIGDGTIIRLLVEYGPQILVLLLAILEKFNPPQPTS